MNHHRKEKATICTTCCPKLKKEKATICTIAYPKGQVLCEVESE